jgi:hypothetical protein
MSPEREKLEEAMQSLREMLQSSAASAEVKQRIRELLPSIENDLKRAKAAGNP